ncbi:MAG: transposase, partial [Bacteriovoracaceae bacterium]
GSVTFIQRFGSMNLNVHFHILYADGVFYKNEKSKIVFEHSKKPTTEEVKKVNTIIKKRVVRYLKKQGVLYELEEGNHQFEYSPKQDGLDSIYQNSIKQKIGNGKRKGKGVEKVGATRVTSWSPKTGERSSYLDGFSLHANVDVSGNSRDKLENLIKYTARPPLANSRISEDFSGHILYELKNKYTDGTTHLRFTPTEFIEKIIAIIPPPRRNLIRFFGVFGPHHRYREEITNMIKCRSFEVSKKGKMVEVKKVFSESERIDKQDVIQLKPTYWIPWIDLLKKTFNLDALKCEKCGGIMKVANLVTKPHEIKMILSHFDEKIVEGLSIRSVHPPPSVRYDYIPDYEYQE